MLIVAEGTVHHPVEGDARLAAQAWLGPMVDEGFAIDGYFDDAGHRLWIVLSSPDVRTAQQRLDDISVTRDGSVSFALTVVTRLRFR
jgi:hypothetical protein